MHEAITNNLDLWTSALLTKSSTGRGRNGKQDAYGIKKLRELILDLAVRGKLVPQKDVWTAVSLSDLGAWAVGNGFPKSKQGNEGLAILFAKVSDMNLPENAKFIVKTNHTISEKTAREMSVNVHPPGTVVFPKIGGAIATNKRRILTRPTAIDNNCLGITPQEGVSTDWLYLVLSSIDFTKYQAGTSLPALSQRTLAMIPVALPGLTEQHRIVAKVDELMALCDQLEQQQNHSLEAHQTLVETLLGTLTRVASQQELSEAWARIAGHFDTLFTTEHSVYQLKQTILQLAVMGKLVPQDPNDEPAAKLLERIDQASKCMMRTRGKEDEKSDAQFEAKSLFELPTGWKWASFGWLPQQACVGIDRSRAQQGPDKAYAYFKMNNIRNTGGVDLSDLTRIDATPDEVETFALSDGDFLFNTRNSRQLVGKTCVFWTFSDDPVLYNNNILRVKFIDGFSPDFLDYWFRSPTGRAELEKLKSNTTNVCAIYQGKLSTLPCVVPPLAEQHRIVAKVDELMALCDALKARINDAQTTQIHLADAIVERAVA